MPYQRYTIHFMIAGIMALAFNSPPVSAQGASYAPSTNRSYSSLEKDILIYADNRFTVTQTGSATVQLPMLFDGNFQPCYTSTAPTEEDPTVITISGIPALNLQLGVKIGWTTRYWAPTKFKIEGYNNYGSSPGWKTLADVSDYAQSDYSLTETGTDAYSQLRFTFYAAAGADGKMGLSELFFLHAEAAQAYDGLMVKYQPNGNVLIGKTSQTNTSYKLDVNGDVRANRVVVNTTGADYVFDSAYQTMPLDSLQKYLTQYHHLPGMAPASIMQQQGLSLGEAYTQLLSQLEQSTLYILQLQKDIKAKDTTIATLRNLLPRMDTLERRLSALENAQTTRP